MFNRRLALRWAAILVMYPQITQITQIFGILFGFVFDEKHCHLERSKP
jgi:hypothetical protein